MNRKELIIQTVLTIIFTGGVGLSFYLLSIVYSAAPFSFFGMSNGVRVSLAFISISIAVIVAILLLRRRSAYSSSGRRKRH